MDEINLDEIYENLVKAELGPPETLAQDPILVELKHRNPKRRIAALRNKEVKLHHLLIGIRDRDASVVAEAAGNAMLPPQFLRSIWRHPNPEVRRNVITNPSLPPELIDEMLAGGLEPLSMGDRGYERYSTLEDFVQNPALKEHHLGQIQNMINGNDGHAPNPNGDDRPLYDRPLSYLIDNIIQHPSYNAQLLNQSVLDALNDPTGGGNRILQAAMSSPNLRPETITQVLDRGPLDQTQPDAGRKEFDDHLDSLIKRTDLTSGHLMQILKHPNMPNGIVNSLYDHDDLKPEHVEQILFGKNPEDLGLGWYDIERLTGHEHAWTPELRARVAMHPKMDSDIKTQVLEKMDSPQLLNVVESGPDHYTRERALRKLVNRDDLTPEMRNTAAKHAFAEKDDLSMAQLALSMDDLDPTLLDWYVRNTDSPAMMVKAAARPETLPQTVDFVVNHPDASVRAMALRNGELRLSPEHISRFLTDQDDSIRDSVAANHSENFTDDHFRYVFDHPELFGSYRRRGLLYNSDVPRDVVGKALFSPDAEVRDVAAKSARLPAEEAWRYLDDPNGSDTIKHAITGNKAVPLQPRHIDAMLNSGDGYKINRAIDHNSMDVNRLKSLLADDAWHETNPGYGDDIRSRIKSFDPDLGYTPLNVRFGTGKLRKVRDLILKNGQDEMKPRDLPAGDWSAGRMPNGNISAKKLQAAIDAINATRYNISETTWGGMQRHSGERQKVMQLNLSTDMLNKLKEQGVYDYWNKVAEPYRGPHPSHEHTLGWVRYSGDPQDGIFIDEVQSDIANSPHAKGIAYVKQNTKREHYPSDAAHLTALNQKIETVRKNANENFGTEEQHKTMLKILFGGKHPNEVLHEAFQQHLRDQGHIGTKIAVHTPETKAPISGLEEARAMPVHFKIAYEDQPKKMGMEPGVYSTETMPTMDGSVPSGSRVWVDTVKKYEKLQGAIRKLILSKLEK